MPNAARIRTTLMKCVKFTFNLAGQLKLIDFADSGSQSIGRGSCGGIAVTQKQFTDCMHGWHVYPFHELH